MTVKGRTMSQSVTFPPQNKQCTHTTNIYNIFDIVWILELVNFYQKVAFRKRDCSMHAFICSSKETVFVLFQILFRHVQSVTKIVCRVNFTLFVILTYTNKIFLWKMMWQRLLLRPGHLKCTYGRSGRFPVGEINSSQTATIVVVKQPLGSWSHLWSLSNVSGCGSTSLFGSHAGTHQIRDQSRTLEDRNDCNNSLEVYTPNSFIHLFYNSPYMDIVDMHNVLITPSDSVLRAKTVEAS